jgi:predicted nucleic-acid-binding protein
MAAADTNVLLRLLVRDDPAQVNAAETFIAGGAWVSHVVLAEVTWVLQSLYGQSRNAVGAAVQQMLMHPAVTLQDPDVVIKALALFGAHQKVAFADCLILEIARKAGQAPLATFDRDLAKLDGAQRIGANA